MPWRYLVVHWFVFVFYNIVVCFLLLVWYSRVFNWGFFPLGLSGSGKSTIASALEQVLLNKKINCFRLDGDNVRFGLNSNLVCSFFFDFIFSISKSPNNFSLTKQILFFFFFFMYRDSPLKTAQRMFVVSVKSLCSLLTLVPLPSPLSSAPTLRTVTRSARGWISFFFFTIFCSPFHHDIFFLNYFFLVIHSLFLFPLQHFPSYLINFFPPLSLSLFFLQPSSLGCPLSNPFLFRHEEAGLKFIEVFVNTPLAECEKRDPKGLYKKARAGEIPQFTGISAPYEEPENAEIVLLTAEKDVDACCEQVLEYLVAQGLVKA